MLNADGTVTPEPGSLLEQMHEEILSRARPAGIDDWCAEIEAKSKSMLAAMTCQHSEMLAGNYASGAHAYTYVVQAESGGLVKIGRAQHVPSRLVEIQSMSPVRLDVVAIAEGLGLERLWHKQFYKLRRHREWFDGSAADWFRNNGAPGCVRCVTHKDGVQVPPHKTRKPRTP